MIIPMKSYEKSKPICMKNTHQTNIHYLLSFIEFGNKFVDINSIGFYEKSYDSQVVVWGGP